ncbi:MAG: GAK system CofD-like protein [Desulfovibrio sp.]|nr:GAK system CofD-like protein [Desulfovibrio sp.]
MIPLRILRLSLCLGDVLLVNKFSPQLLFFTGGSALRDLSHYCALKEERSIHIVTTFDSGGSTAELRRCFAIPAMGDLRNRLLALADPSLPTSLTDFLKLRLPKEGEQAALFSFLHALADPNNPSLADLEQAARFLLTSSLGSILAKLPPHFDLRGASVGNLILTSLYLEHGRNFGASLAILGRLLKVRGRVLPVVEESLHLGCVLESGAYLLGQHKFKHLTEPIRSIFLTVHDPEHPEKFEPKDICWPQVSSAALAGIRLADVVCYPMGSFYSSVLVNLSVRGVAKAIAKLICPKIFIPNLGYDPEQRELSVEEQIRILLDLMHKDAPTASAWDFLNYVLVDKSAGEYQGRLLSSTAAKLSIYGVTLLDLPLCRDPLHLDPALTIRAIYTCIERFREN